MTMPNFMILGAAKAGTTALYAYLAQHPQIYMSRIKEPNFFAYGDAPPPALQGPGADVIRRNAILSRAAYEQLYQGATTQRAIGEASISNLWARACERIKAHVPDAKLIAILRQPAERAYSNFLYNRALGFEPLGDFAAALADEPRRREQQWSPVFCYRAMSHYAENLERYFAYFPRAQIRVYLYDDFVAQPQQLLGDLFRFLAVDEQFVPDTTARYNVTQLPRSQWLANVLRQPHPLKAWSKMLVPPALRRRLVHWTRQNNRQKPPPLAPALRHQLTQSLQPDIARLQRLLGRDLSHWLR
jgi:hypothetical protein